MHLLFNITGAGRHTIPPPTSHLWRMTTQVVDGEFDEENEAAEVELLDNEGGLDEMVGLILDSDKEGKWVFTVGRATSCDIQLDDLSVSNHHASIRARSLNYGCPSTQSTYIPHTHP